MTNDTTPQPEAPATETPPPLPKELPAAFQKKTDTPQEKRPVEDPVWWRYGAIPFLVLIMAAACADTGMYRSGAGLGTAVACLLLTSAILLLRKDFSKGERCFLGALAGVNFAALAYSGSGINGILGIAIPFIIQFIPSKQTVLVPERRFRTWWGFWFAHRKAEKADGERKGFARLRSAMPLIICILVGAIFFISFLTIFAHGNPVVQMVWDTIVDTWNKLVAYLHISWDILFHVIFWVVGILLFGLFTFRRPALVDAPQKPAAPAEEPAGNTILPYLPICSLIGIDLAFLIATSTDIAYLWFGNVPEGISQTEYLHDGAASITWASALAAGLLVFFFRRAGSARRSRACKVAGYLLVIQTFLLAVSVYMRLYYQISDYGFTVRRIMAAEAMLLGLAGLVVLVFYMACSGAFWKYTKICLGTMLIMLVSFGISSPARLAGDLNMRYHATHPHWEFSQWDFGIGRFSVRENLAFAYYVYNLHHGDESANLRQQIITQAERVHSECADYFYEDNESGWKHWTCALYQEYPVAVEILDKLAEQTGTDDVKQETTAPAEATSNP